MAYLLDTNILLRIAQPLHPLHEEARRCVRTLLRQKEIVHIVPQIIFEFWVVATRPASNNGLGLSIGNAKRMVGKAESFFRFVLDPQPIYSEWLLIVQTFAVSGLNARDARIVAAMKVHGIDHLVTFNDRDFSRYHRKAIIVLSPREILSSFKG